MTSFLFIWRNASYKPLAALFQIILLAIGVALILTLSHVGAQLDARMQKDLKGIDLVVSGKGSPLQIILCAVFHIDFPTGNIPASEAAALTKNPLVKLAIPLALGDNYKGFRIVGTNKDYVTHYNGSLAQGRLFASPMEVVLGSDVALVAPMKLGDHLVGAHGLVSSDDLHTDFPYTVVGVLQPTGSVLDRLVLTPLESVWHVHEHPDADDPDGVAYKKDHPENEITALLISYRTPLAVAQLPRLVDKSSSMMAASPAFEVARLNKIFGVGRDVISYFGYGMLVLAGAGFFITILQATEQRRYDIALLRVMGCSRGRVIGLLVGEAALLGGTGAVTGFLLSQAADQIIHQMILDQKHIALDPAGMSPLDWGVIFVAVVLSVLAGLLPALRAGKLDIAHTLACG